MAEIAIISFTNYPKGQTRPCMKAVMAYTMQDKKTQWQERSLVSGLNCRPESVYDNFLSTKLLCHKDGGTLFYHMVQSHPKGAEVNPVTAHAAAMELAKYFDGREVLVCTHVDRDHVHSHFIINSVSLEDGRKLHIATPELAELRQRNDHVCQQFGLSVFQSGQKKKVRSMSTAEYHAAAKGESWKLRLMNVIDECMKYAGNRDAFITLMRSEGYDVRWQASRKNITYTTPSGMKCRDERLHDPRYLKEAMEHEFRIRERIVLGGIEAAERATEGTGAAGLHTGAASHPRGMDGVVGLHERAVPHNGSPLSSDPADAHTPDESSNAGTGSGAAAGVEGDQPTAQTGWEGERAVFLAPSAPAAPSAPVPGPDAHPADFAGALGGVVQLGHALERTQDTSHVRDAASMPIHMDKKAQQKLREKRIALGHKADDHEEQQTWNQSM